MLRTESSANDELSRLLGGQLIASLYQPVIDLHAGTVAGYEALARAPQDSPLRFPDQLFAAAREAGRLTELDAACRCAALAGAAGTGVESVTLLINTEPDTTAESMVATYRALAALGTRQRVVFELTERALTDDPAAVLAAARELRSLGAGIALDDVGTDPRSLALLPFVQPDVVKLDMSIVQGARSAAAARVMLAVGAYAEATGAQIIAEGIETAEHLATARALGATHGQGWLFGRPAPAPASHSLEHPSPMQLLPVAAVTTPPATPYQQALSAGLVVQDGDKALILALSRQLERHATTLGAEAVVLANVQHAERFTTRTAERYALMAEELALVGIVGTAVPDHPSGRVRGGAFPPQSLLAPEWTVTVISPHFAAAMLAVDLGDRDVPDMARRFSYTLTYNRELVATAARTLMAELTRDT